jgi:hypothetical protein
VPVHQCLSTFVEETEMAIFPRTTQVGVSQVSTRSASSSRRIRGLPALYFVTTFCDILHF